jgi:hypothetical protein
MDLDRHVEELRRHLRAAVDGGDEATRETAERLGAALDAAAHLVLLDVVGEAAAEVTRELAPGSVEVRLRGRHPELVVTPAAEPDAPNGARSAAGAADPGAGDDGATARINLRLSETLKAQVDRAASDAGTSTNTWLVRAATAALAAPAGAPGRRPSRRAGLAGDRLTGWVR